MEDVWTQIIRFIYFPQKILVLTVLNKPTSGGLPYDWKSTIQLLLEADFVIWSFE